MLWPDHEAGWVDRVLVEQRDSKARQAPLGAGRRATRRLRRLTLLRNGVQVAFALFLLYTGWQFQRFVAHFESGGVEPYVPRPASVEAFLPLSALVAFKSWLGTGVFDRIHPAGLVLFLTIVGVSVLYKKGFCSWICPIGALSEALARLGRRSFGTNLSMPGFLDWPLRGLKYLLLGFFLSAILLGMSAREATLFLQGPYNKIADVKMLQFFTSPGPEVVAFLIALGLLSMLFSNFWCRYLCPYGALLGLASLLSPLKVARDPERCTGCGRCTRACPNRLEVARAGQVWSPECTGCLECVAACPQRGALGIGLPGRKPRVNPWLFPALLLGTFFVAAVAARLSGHWETGIPYAEYARLIPRADQFSH